MRDSILELWLRLLALHIEESREEEFIGRKIRDSWLLASRGYFNVLVSVCFTSAPLIAAPVMSITTPVTDEAC
jgi:hypothetical protein